MDASRHPLQAYSNFTRENVNRIRNISFLILVLKEIENLHLSDFSGSVEDDGCLPPLAYRYCISCDICGSLAASTVLARMLRVWIPDDIRFRPSSDLVFNQVNSVPNSVFSTNVVGSKQSILSCRGEFSYSGTGMACVCKASFCNPIWCFSLPCKVGLSLYFYLQTKWLFTLLFTLICKMYIIVCLYNQVFSWSGLFFILYSLFSFFRASSIDAPYTETE